MRMILAEFLAGGRERRESEDGRAIWATLGGEWLVGAITTGMGKRKA
jgi:hypothetical protein